MSYVSIHSNWYQTCHCGVPSAAEKTQVRTPTELTDIQSRLLGSDRAAAFPERRPFPALEPLLPEQGLCPACETDGMAPALLRALFVIVAASASDCGAG